MTKLNDLRNQTLYHRFHNHSKSNIKKDQVTTEETNVISLLQWYPKYMN